MLIQLIDSRHCASCHTTCKVSDRPKVTEANTHFLTESLNICILEKLTSAEEIL